MARPSDLDEVIEAARIYAEEKNCDHLVKAAETRLEELAREKLGKDWYEKGLLNVPSFYEEVGLSPLVALFNAAYYFSQ